MRYKLHREEVVLFKFLSKAGEIGCSESIGIDDGEDGSSVNVKLINYTWKCGNVEMVCLGRIEGTFPYRKLGFLQI